MLPVDFPERNKILHGPKDSDILDLPVFNDDVACISCWELTDDEKQHISKSRAIWIDLHSREWEPQMNISALCPFGRKYTAQRLPVQWFEKDRAIYCWPLTDDEIELIQFTGKIWFTIVSGYTQPPVGFFTRSPFVEHENP